MPIVAEPGESAEAVRAARAPTRSRRSARSAMQARSARSILEPRCSAPAACACTTRPTCARARELCDAHGVHLIADEIAVGFGRTGTLFACEQAGITPDFLCLSKGLTGGFLPLSAVLTTQAVYDAFLDDSRERAFLHSHSYTGNPLACAAALASLDIFDSDDVLERNRATAARMAALAAPLAAHPHVADVRQTGMIVAFELTATATGARRSPAPRVGLRAYRAALARGVRAASARRRAVLDAAVLHRRRGAAAPGRGRPPPPSTRRPPDAPDSAATSTSRWRSALRVALPEAAHAHLVRVLRLRRRRRPASCSTATATTTTRGWSSLAKRGAQVEVLARRALGNESPLRDHAGAGHRARREDGLDPAEGDRAGRRLHRAGGHRPHRSEAGRRARRQARGALARRAWPRPASRAGAATLPALLPPQSLAKFAGADGNTASPGTGSRGRPVAGGDCAFSPAIRITLVIGPEGGLSERDLLTLRAARLHAACAWGRASCARKPPASPRWRHCRRLYGDWR